MNNPSIDDTVARTPAAGCAACEAKRVHTAEDWRHHPLAGHGMTREQGASHPALENQ